MVTQHPVTHRASGRLLPLVLTLIFTFALIGAPVQAQSLQPPLDPVIYGEIQAQGSAKVIVELISAATTQSDVSAQRASIASAQNAVLSGVAAGDFQVIYRYDAIPALVGVVNQTGLQALQNNPLVSKIYLDFPVYADNLEARQLVNADDVATSFGYDGTGVKVAVLDTGVDTDHPHLASAIVDQQCFLSGGGCPGGGTAGNSAEDGDGHGTHVSGTILGRGPNTGGQEGGFAPAADLVSIKVLDDSGFGDLSNVVSAFNYLITNHPDVDIVNMSLGGTAFTAVCNGVYPALETAITNLDTIVFVASGNDAFFDKIGYPSCLSTVISVGAVYTDDFGGLTWGGGTCSDATTAADKITCFSNSASFLSILAPGALMNSTYPGGGYASMGGTSMATPAASGVAALMLQANPNLTQATMLAAMQSTGVSIVDARNGHTFKRIDALAAINAVTVPSQPTGLSATAVSQTQIDLSWNDVDGETGYRVEWSADGSTGWAEAGSVAADTTTYSHTALTCNTTYHYRVIATNANGDSAPSDMANTTTQECDGSESIELVVNGNFDDNDDPTPKLPDSWVSSGKLAGDKVRTDEATTLSHSAPNMFQFKAKPNEGTSILFQNIDLAANPLSVGDTLVLSAFVNQKSAPANLVIGKFVIKYNDGSKKTQVKLRMPASKTQGYVQLSTEPFVISNANITKMNVQFYYLHTSGKYFVDDVSLSLTPASAPTLGVIGLPAAPSDLRGQ